VDDPWVLAGGWALEGPWEPQAGGRPGAPHQGRMSTLSLAAEVDGLADSSPSVSRVSPGQHGWLGWSTPMEGGGDRGVREAPACAVSPTGSNRGVHHQALGGAPCDAWKLLLALRATACEKALHPVARKRERKPPRDARQARDARTKVKSHLASFPPVARLPSGYDLLERAIFSTPSDGKVLWIPGLPEVLCVYIRGLSWSACTCWAESPA